MKVFDFHTHIYPERIARKATESVLDFYGFLKGYEGTADALIEDGKGAGITNFLLLPVAIRADQVRGINSFVAEKVGEHEEFYGFGTVHAEMGDICGEVERIQGMGLRGIKLHPDTQGFDIDDARLFDMYDMIRGRLPLMLHTGDYRYDYSHPRRVKRLLEEFPGLTVIAAHFGGWSMADEALECLKDTNCYVDISSSTMFMSRKKCEYLISQYGEDRVLFGSDYPLWSPSKELESFMEISLSDDAREKILWKNAQRLLDEGV